MYKNVYTAKGHHVKQNKANTERQVLHVFSYRWKLGKDLKRGIKEWEGSSRAVGRGDFK